MRVPKEQLSIQVLDADYPKLPENLNKYNDKDLYQVYVNYYHYATEEFQKLDMGILSPESVLRSLIKKGCYSLS